MTKLSTAALHAFLEEKTKLYNQSAFIESDPVSIPHLFSKREDIEISAFLTATIAWGQRKTIINNAKRLMELMDYAPHQFLLSFENKDLKGFRNFKHRTFNQLDCVFFLKTLRSIYSKSGGLESAFNSTGTQTEKVKQGIINARKIFFLLPHQTRQEKHFSNPTKGSASKRLNMFLRWMVRKDPMGVDFGIWNSILPAELMCPLDVHSGRVARSLGLLERKQDDWQAVSELTSNLRQFDPRDPVKFDYALFGLGVFEKF